MESEPLLLASLVLDAVTANIKKCDWSGIQITEAISYIMKKKTVAHMAPEMISSVAISCTSKEIGTKAAFLL